MDSDSFHALLCPGFEDAVRAGWAEDRCGRRNVCPANGSDVKLRGQGPRGYGRAARRLPAFEARDAGGVTPTKLR
jgi:hypothetical protein